MGITSIKIIWRVVVSVPWHFFFHTDVHVILCFRPFWFYRKIILKQQLFFSWSTCPQPLCFFFRLPLGGTAVYILYFIDICITYEVYVFYHSINLCMFLGWSKMAVIKMAAIVFLLWFGLASALDWSYKTLESSGKFCPQRDSCRSDFFLRLFSICRKTQKHTKKFN